jgi:hypothetical protein
MTERHYCQMLNLVWFQKRIMGGCGRGTNKTVVE